MSRAVPQGKWGQGLRWIGLVLGWSVFAAESWRLVAERSFLEYWRNGLLFFLLGVLVQHFTSSILRGRSGTARRETSDPLPQAAADA